MFSFRLWREVNIYYAANQVSTLISVGEADCKAKDDKGNTPLHHAFLHVEQPDLKVVKVLVRSGANLHEPNNEGKTPWGIAQEKFPQWCEQGDVKKS